MMSLKVDRIDDRTLLVNGRRVEFPIAVWDYLPLWRRVLVLLASQNPPYTPEHLGRNLVCLDSNGRLLWRVQSTGVPGTMDGSDTTNGWLSGVWRDGETGKIKAGTLGLEFTRDPRTGRLSDAETNR